MLPALGVPRLGDSMGVLPSYTSIPGLFFSISTMSSDPSTGPIYEYVCGGALMQCDKGIAPSPLHVLRRSPTLAGQPWAILTATRY